MNCNASSHLNITKHVCKITAFYIVCIPVISTGVCKNTCFIRLASEGLNNNTEHKSYVKLNDLFRPIEAALAYIFIELI